MQTQIKNLPLKKLVIVDGNKARLDLKLPVMKELIASVEAKGVLQPIIVGPAPDDPDRLAVIAGRRRTVAARAAGLMEILCIVTDAGDQEAAEISVIENLQREDLAPLEEASEIQKLLDRGWETQDVADHIGKSPTWVVRRGNLKKLSKEWRRALGDPKHPEHDRVSMWPAGWLELVARCSSEEKQNHILDENWDIQNRKALEVWCFEDALLLAKAPWKKDDGTLAPEAGPCDECKKRSSHRPGLFDDWGLDPAEIKKTDKCLEPKCWEKKAAAYVERKEAELREKCGDVVRVTGSYSQGPKDATHENNIQKLNNKAHGAKLCIKVDGPNAGQVFYGKPYSSSSSRTSCSAGAGKKKGPSPLKERKKVLDKRREALVNGWLRKKLEDKAYPGMAVGRYSDEKLLQHLIAFGTYENKKHSYYGGGSPWNVFKSFTSADGRKTQSDIKEKLWRSVFQVMESRLHHNGNPPAKEHELLCKHHGDLLNVTIKDLRKKAAEELPDPKSWAGLNADGSPKNAKATKAIKDRKIPRCKVKGCNTKVSGLGMCAKHFTDATRTKAMKKACKQKPATKSPAKSPAKSPTESRTKSQVAKGIKACKVKGCEMPAYTHGMCSTHFVDWASKTKKGGKKK